MYLQAGLIIKIAGILAERVQLRGARSFFEGGIPSTEELIAIGGASRDEVQYLSNLQLAIYRRNYGSPTDYSAVGIAFASFANGEMRFVGGVRNAEPDSAFEFSFAEFALTAIDFGVDVSEWTALLPQLAKSQRVFMEVYRPANPQPTYREWLAENFDETRQVDEAFKGQLQEEFAGLSTQQIAEKVGQNAARAFAGDYILPI
jgi:hypothetical protein